MNPGTVVRLKSGGPSMTITKVNGEWAHVTYFDEKHNLKEGDFLQVTLIDEDEEAAAATVSFQPRS